MRKLIFGIILLSSFPAAAQLVDPMESDESKFFIQTKQVNQFFRRFNGEESEEGDRYYKDNSQFRNNRLRRKYLHILFDDSNPGITKSLKNEFINSITTETPAFLNFHEPGWFAEVNAEFTYNGQPENATLYMILEAAGLGYKWVIDKVHFSPFLKIFKTDTTQKFLHPMSHELYFLNMRRVFEDPKQAVKYTSEDWQPEQLTLFLQEVRNGTLKFNTINDVKFHFFQVPGWYFEVSEFHRPGYNTGWLISNLMKLDSPGEKEIMQGYIYNEKK
jgi:hypothetical protein